VEEESEVHEESSWQYMVRKKPLHAMNYNGDISADGHALDQLLFGQELFPCPHCLHLAQIYRYEHVFVVCGQFPELNHQQRAVAFPPPLFFFVLELATVEDCGNKDITGISKSCVSVKTRYTRCYGMALASYIIRT